MIKHLELPRQKAPNGFVALINGKAAVESSYRAFFNKVPVKGCSVFALKEGETSGGELFEERRRATASNTHHFALEE